MAEYHVVSDTVVQRETLLFQTIVQVNVCVEFRIFFS